MRPVGPGGAAAALAVASIAALAQPAHADTAFQVQTAATGVHFTLTQRPAASIITASLVDDATAYTASAFDASGSSEAQAASVYPGNLVVQGPSLFCTQLFTCPVSPPDYPLLADASYPRRSHAEAAADQKPVGSGPLVVSPGSSVATASQAGNDAQTSSAGVNALPGSAAAVTIGASSSVTHIATTADGLVVHVLARVSDVTIAGIVHIASIDASDDVTLHTGARPHDVPHITVTGVTVAGQTATIDETGVHVAGHNGPTLTQTLARNGVSLHTVGVDRADTTSAARSVATGLEVDMSVPVSGLPYIPNPLPAPFDQIPGVDANGTYLGRLTLGAAGIVAGANVQPAFNLGGFSPLTPPSSSATTTAATQPGEPPSVGAVPAPAAQPQVAAPQGGLSGFLDAVTTDLANLYAVLALGTAALFVGWRGAVWTRRRAAAGRRA